MGMKLQKEKYKRKCLKDFVGTLGTCIWRKQIQKSAK